MTDIATKATGAEAVRWDLTDLYTEVTAPEIESDIKKLHGQADSFAEKYRGQVASLSPEALAEAVKQYEQVLENLSRITVYAFLIWTTDTKNPDYGKLFSRSQQLGNEINQKVLFFELEWMKAPESTAVYADHPALKRYQHYLKVARLNAPYALSEKEEQVISELSLSGEKAWQRFFGEFNSAARYELEGRQLSQSEILNNLRLPDRDLRRRSADAFTAGLHKLTHSATFTFNMLAMNKRSIDKMRGFPTWISSRNLSNQTDDATVEALVDAVTSRYDIVARFYRLLKRMLGYDELFDYDRYAPVLDETWSIEWNEARSIVLDAYQHFSPRMADIARLFFDKNWIDAPPDTYKRGGAYSSSTVPSVHPYIFMNYLGLADNVMTLAHELGHGVHQYLAREQGYLQADTPLTTAEMASTFGEMLVFEALLKQIDNPKARLALRLEKISDAFATVFRQIAMNRFEDLMHNTIRREGELTTEQLGAFWLQTQRAMFGDSVTLREEYSIWWSYIPHFLNVPGYVYAYSFGELLVWTLYARYQQEGGDFAERYLQALTAGGSMYPHELLKPLGVNLKDPSFWHSGLGLIEDMVALAEKEADTLD